MRRDLLTTALRKGGVAVALIAVQVSVQAYAVDSQTGAPLKLRSVDSLVPGGGTGAPENPLSPRSWRASTGYLELASSSNSADVGDAPSPVRSEPSAVQDVQARGAMTSKSGIEELVMAAINTHPSIAARKADLAGAEADIRTALWQYFPTPSVGTKRDDRGKNTLIMSVQQPLWAGGRIDAGHDAAKARASSAEVSILEARHNLAANLSGAYQSWMQYAGRAEALTRSVRFHEDQAKSIRRRVDGGVTAEVDLELVFSRLAQVRADLAAAQSSTRVALTRLSQLVGKPLIANDVAKASADNVNDGSIPKTLEAMIQATAQTYPTLRRLDADVEAAQHEVRVKRSVMWPTLAVRAEREQNDAYIATLGSRTDNRVLFTVDFTPGAGLTAVSGADAAQAKALSLRESREAAYREMVDRVSSDYEDFTSSKSRRVELIRTRKAAIDVLASYSRQFEAGKRGWLDVMNAARELTQVDTSLADVDAQVVATAYRLRLYAGQPEWYGSAESGN